MKLRMLVLTRPLLLAALVAAGCATLPDGVPTPTEDDAPAARLTLPDGRTLAVDPDRLSYTGSARLERPDGRVYDGELRDGVPHGSGTAIEPDGTHYEGDWVAGDRDGYGRLVMANGSHYEGEWRQDLRSGTGTWVEADGTRYQGEWVADRPHGFGILEASDGGSYTGEWSAGARHGYGRTEEPSGLVYEGTWQDDRRHGYGEEHRPDGSRYVGEWQQGKRHGQGRETRADGSFHDGTWEVNQTLGPGLRRAASGIVISGMWNNDSVSTGLLTLPTGPEYAGPLFADAGRAAAPRLIDWLTRVAEQGDPYAQLMLGTLRLELERPPADVEAARQWLGRAAAAGIAEAAYRLAQTLLDERPPRVVELLSAAANQGHAEANRQLGRFYDTGYTVPPSVERAVQYYERAVEAGSVAARNDLAWLLATTADQRYRNGERALQLIRPIALHTGRWQYLDTLAAAWAAVGDFESAVAVAGIALDSYDQSDADDRDSVRAAMAARLAGYRNQQPVVEPDAAREPVSLEPI
jgi:hypothetical protein